MKTAIDNYIDTDGRTLLDRIQDYRGYIVNEAALVDWIRDNGGLLSSEL